MTTLEQLLEENYDELKSGECKQKVVEYIFYTDSVAHRSLDFIKKLTKVGQRVYEQDKDILQERRVRGDSYLKKLYRFNKEGIAKIQANEPREYPSNCQAHLLAYAGDVAMYLSRETHQLRWTARWYAHHLRAAERIQSTEPAYAARNYGLAGKAAGVLAVKTGEIEWFKASYEANRRAAETIEPVADWKATRHWLFAAERAADTSDNYYNETGYSKTGRFTENDIYMAYIWAEKAIECYEKFLVSPPLGSDEESLSQHIGILYGTLPNLHDRKNGLHGQLVEEFAWYEEQDFDGADIIHQEVTSSTTSLNPNATPNLVLKSA